MKDGSELAEVTTGGRLFHTREVATPNARSLTGARSQSLECFRLISPVQIIGEIRRRQVMSTTVNLYGQSKLNAFWDPQPVQVSKQMCDVVVLP